MDDLANGEFRPPYLSFKTFWTFVGELISQPLPPKIDRSLMRSKSGSDQVNLTSAMKAFGLIDGSQIVTGLRELAGADEAGRTQWLGLQVRKHYSAQMKVSYDNGTEQQLRDSFRESFKIESADTIRKAMTFFLHAARTAGIETSSYFPSTRSGSGAPGTAKPRRGGGKRKPPAPPKDNEGAGSVLVDGDTYTLPMKSGPVVTLAVKMNVMEASVEDRDFIFKLVDSLRGYGKPPETSGSAKEAAGHPAESTEDSP